VIDAIMCFNLFVCNFIDPCTIEKANCLIDSVRSKDVKILINLTSQTNGIILKMKLYKILIYSAFALLFIQCNEKRNPENSPTKLLYDSSSA